MHSAAAFPSDLSDMMNWMVRTLLYVMLGLLALKLVLILLAHGISVLFDRLVEKLRGARVRRARTLEDVLTRDGAAFERLCVELFAARGYRARRTGGRSDGGIDLVATSDTGKVVVQCKAWRHQRVGVSVARELLGTVTAAAAEHGYLITTSRFTRDAEDFARSQPITLIDGDAFVREVRAHLPRTLVDEAVAGPLVPAATPGVLPAACWPAPPATAGQPAKVPAGYPIICSECGAADTVPFEPRPGAHVLCHACYAAWRCGRARVSSASQ
jgi:CxxC-x17-CxxC domain-containing protein